MYAALLEAVEGGLDARAARLLAVVLQSHEVRRLAHDLLNLVAPASALQIRREGPLTDAPVLHGATLAGAAIARHAARAPVGLAGHLAEVPTGSRERRHVDAHVVRAGVVIAVRAVASPRESRESHARAGAFLEGFAGDVEVPRGDSEDGDQHGGRRGAGKFEDFSAISILGILSGRAGFYVGWIQFYMDLTCVD